MRSVPPMSADIPNAQLVSSNGTGRPAGDSSAFAAFWAMFSGAGAGNQLPSKEVPTVQPEDGPDAADRKELDGSEEPSVDEEGESQDFDESEVETELPEFSALPAPSPTAGWVENQAENADGEMAMPPDKQRSVSGFGLQADRNASVAATTVAMVSTGTGALPADPGIEEYADLKASGAVENRGKSDALPISGSVADASDSVLRTAQPGQVPARFALAPEATEQINDRRGEPPANELAVEKVSGVIQTGNSPISEVPSSQKLDPVGLKGQASLVENNLSGLEETPLFAQPGLGSHVSPVGQVVSGDSMQQVPEIGRQVLQQLSETPLRNRDRIEVSLTPEELGRVRLSATQTDAGVILIVQAERPETLDLMRRHLPDLMQDLRSMGFGDVSYSDGQEKQNAPGRSGKAITQHQAEIPETLNQTIPTSGLDLRL